MNSAHYYSGVISAISALKVAEPAAPKPVQIRLPPQVEDSVRALCVRRGHTFNAVIIECVKAYLSALPSPHGVDCTTWKDEYFAQKALDRLKKAKEELTAAEEELTKLIRG